MSDRKKKLRDIFLCTISGLLLGFSQPFYMPSIFSEGLSDYFGLLAFVGYAPLFFVLEGSKNLKTVFALSIFTATVQFTVVLYWIYIALFVHGNISPLPAALITLVLPFTLALMDAVFLVLGRFLSTRFNMSFFLIAPFIITAGEYFRNFYLFGGFPWGNVGYSIGRIDQFLQMASLVGVYGLVFFVGCINSLLCLFWTTRHNRGAYRILVATLLILTLSYFYGALRLKNGENEFAPSIRIALLQGNIAQETKKSSSLYADDILAIYFDLHNKAKAEGAELIVWPESSYPRLLDKNVSSLPFKFEDLKASIIGAVVFGRNEDGKSYYVHNAGLIMDYQGQIIKRYYKSHLVPFGEYVPWPMTGIVDRIVPGLGAFKPGTDFFPVKLSLSLGKQISVGTTICYEGIFPEISRAYAKNGANLLVNLTNDAWYGYSSAPYQHLLMYRMRSVETGLSFLRATNTGISAWIDPYGKIRQTLPLFERGVIVDDVPTITKKTLYVMIGDVVPIFSILLLVLGYIAAVLPLHQFVRLRQYHKLLLVALLTAIAIAVNCYFLSDRFLADESARTKNLMVSLLILLVMIGLLTKTRRSRSILLASSVVIVFCSVALAIFESPYFLLGLLLGLLIYLLAFRIKEDDKPVR